MKWALSVALALLTVACDQPVAPDHLSNYYHLTLVPSPSCLRLPSPPPSRIETDVYQSTGTDGVPTFGRTGFDGGTMLLTIKLSGSSHVTGTVWGSAYGTDTTGSQVWFGTDPPMTATGTVTNDGTYTFALSGRLDYCTAFIPNVLGCGPQRSCQAVDHAASLIPRP